MHITNAHCCDVFVMGWRTGLSLCDWTLHVWVHVAGVVVVSVEGHDVSESLGLPESLEHSESWDILSLMRHSLSARRYSRIAAENRVLHYHPHDKRWMYAPVTQAMELIDGVLYSSL
jgi:hypothetical protein